jgi:hypothetical protein
MFAAVDVVCVRDSLNTVRVHREMDWNVSMYMDGLGILRGTGGGVHRNLTPWRSRHPSAPRLDIA